MALAVQTLLGNRLKLATDELIKAIEELGPERMAIEPEGKCRSALDQAAECAMISGFTAQTLREGGYAGGFDMEAYTIAKDELKKDWSSLKALLVKNAGDIAEAALAVPDEKLPVTMKLPWGELSYEDLMIYPYWNASYHTGQVNYINFLIS